MKKLILLAGLSIAIFSCAPQASPETMKLQRESDSISGYTRILEKYTAHKLELMGAGMSEAEAKKSVDSSYREQYPIKGAEWNN